MKNCKIPTTEQCFELLKKYHVPVHIIRHCEVVAGLGLFLARRLKEKGLPVNPVLVHRAGLVHDIARVCDFKEIDVSKLRQTVTEQDRAEWKKLKHRYRDTAHEDAAFDILKDDYPELALIVRKHRYMAMADERTRPAIWEEKLLYYCDMRVMQDRIVPLKTRLADAHKRNIHLHGSEIQSQINAAVVDPLIYNLEEEIFRVAGLKPGSIDNDFIDAYIHNNSGSV